MKSSRLLRYFDEYMKKIDMNNSWSKAKYFHSLKSMDLAKKIASSFNIFTEEELVVIELIALYHDIGNFDNNSYNYVDNVENDMTLKSIEILFDEGLLRKITDDMRYDNLIKLAIYCHNKDKLPKNIDDKTRIVCNLMKDVHRIEEIRMAMNYPYIDNRINEYPTSMVYDDFKLFMPIKKNIADNNADNILITLSNIFGLNYPISYTLLEENGYISKMVKYLMFEDKKLEKFFLQIEMVLNNYMKKKIMS